MSIKGCTVTRKHLIDIYANELDAMLADPDRIDFSITLNVPLDGIVTTEIRESHAARIDASLAYINHHKERNHGGNSN